MASPPNYSAISPPAPSSLALPRPKPSLALPGGVANPRRKLSTTSAASSAHPLRQTSFPPPEGRGSPGETFSPDGELDFSDGEISHAINDTGSVTGTATTTGRKRKRGEKKARGRPPKNSSLLNGDNNRSKRSGTAGATPANEPEPEEDEDEDEDDQTTSGKQAAKALNEALQAHEKDQKSFRLHFTRAQEEQFAGTQGVKLRVQDVRKLVNQTLSQSVPANVVNTVQAYTKQFAAMLIENAVEVQREWMAVEDNMPDGRDNGVAKRLRNDKMEGVVRGESSTASRRLEDNATASSSGIQSQAMVLSNGHSHSDDTQPNTEDRTQKHNGEDEWEDYNEEDYEDEIPMGLRRDIEEEDRGPLLPDHLREALRRYKKSRSGGAVGFTGLSLVGKEVAAPRMGGKRLFR